MAADPNPNSVDTDYLAEVACDLADSSFAESTLKKYNEMWAKFIDFCLDFDYSYSECAVIKYVAYLYISGLKYNSIQVHLAAISQGFINRGVEDFAKTPFVLRMVKGAKCMTFSKDSRIPITEQHMRYLIYYMNYYVFSSYEYALFRAIVTWAFAAGLRISEYTESPTVDHNLHRSCVDMINLAGSPAYRITFRSYKCSPDEFPDFVLIENPETRLCPVSAMYEYLDVRPSGYGPLFVRRNGAPVTRKDVGDFLEKACKFHGWNKTQVRPHSFRIGRATLWAQQGFTSEQIEHMGRWKSEAFQKYIRPAAVVLH